jgi:hypothetical protein
LRYPWITQRTSGYWWMSYVELCLLPYWRRRGSEEQQLRIADCELRMEFEEEVIGNI